MLSSLVENINIHVRLLVQSPIEEGQLTIEIVEKSTKTLQINNYVCLDNLSAKSDIHGMIMYRVSHKCWIQSAVVSVLSRII